MLTTGCLICVVQTVGVAVTFEALRDAVSTGTLEVTRVTSPQLCNTPQKMMQYLDTVLGKGERCHSEVTSYGYQAYTNVFYRKYLLDSEYL